MSATVVKSLNPFLAISADRHRGLSYFADDFLYDLSQKIAAADERVCKVILFGSYARGEATEQSDVDICVVYRGTLANDAAIKAAVRRVIEQHLLRYVTDYDLITIPDQVFDTSVPNQAWPIATSIKKDGVVLYEL